jgi:hypothetical protein
MRVGDRAYEPLVRAGITPAEIAELLDALPEWTRAHASTVAVESFAQTLALLHHEGVLVAQDLLIREISLYSGYRGPGKLCVSIVNWLNGPVFQLVGQRGGFRVTVEPFAYRERSDSVVLTARPRDAETRPVDFSPAVAAVA